MEMMDAGLSKIERKSANAQFAIFCSLPLHMAESSLKMTNDFA